MSYRINKSCTQCELCAEACPMGAIERDKNYNFIILINECDECGECIKVCPVGAIVKEDQRQEMRSFLEMEFEKQYIKCSKFQDTEAVIKKAEDKIKETRSIKEREYYAQDILLEAKALISCSNYNSKNQDCLNCHLILLNYIHEYKHLAEDETRKPLVS